MNPLPKIPTLLPGDILLSRSKTWISKAIRYFEKRKTGAAGYSHAALSIVGLSEKPEVIEALWSVTRGPLEKYEGQEIVIYRHKQLTPGQRNEIALAAISRERKGYGITKIPLFALDSIFRPYRFTKWFGVSNFQVCSELIGWAYHHPFKKLPAPSLAANPWLEPFARDMAFNKKGGWRSTTPDDIDDYCRDNADWQVVFNS